MIWGYWLQCYLGTHCLARGLSAKTIAAYGDTLAQFRLWFEQQHPGASPATVRSGDVLQYLEYLRTDRANGNSAVNRVVVVLRGFYGAIVAMKHLQPIDNPMTGFPTIRAAPRKLPVTLSTEEVRRLLATPPTDTIVGLRDRALLALLYATGIRASECAGLKQGDVDFREQTIRVLGKGGHERVIPLNSEVLPALHIYAEARGAALPSAPFFRSRFGRPLTRGAIFERVQTYGRRAHITKPLSPHRLRHTFATHLVRAHVNVVTIRDLLGHRQISSTQIYIHLSAQDLRAAADKHPIKNLIGKVEALLPFARLPFQHVAGLRRYG
jgi:integrase/recombinase XerD